MRRNVVSLAIVISAAALGAPLPAAAQIPEEFTNLQVLPEDIGRQELIAVMRGNALGLGVRCHYCHVGEEGQPFSEYDFASDEKLTKRKARFMLRLVRYLNEERLPELAAVGERADPPVRVTCETCHGGKPVPRPIGEVLTHAIETDGIDAAVEKYRRLREEFYGSAAYDFSELSLQLIADDVSRDDAAAAKRLIELNLEFYPESVNSLLALGRLELREGNREAARAAVNRALELAPDHPQARRLLEMIEGGS